MATNASLIKIGLGVALFIGAVVAGTIGKEAIRELFKRTPNISTQAVLLQVASNINKSCPISVDKDTELLNAIGLEKTIVYNYRLVNISASEIEAGVILEQLKPKVVNSACSQPQTRDGFLKKGITMRYNYVDKDKVFIASFDVVPGDCGF